MTKQYHPPAFCPTHGLFPATAVVIAEGVQNDPKTKAFTEPQDAIKKELAEVRADKSIPAKEKQEALKELNEALKLAKPVQHRGNIELVKKHYDKIEAVLQ